MDLHFRQAEPHENLPVLAGLLADWNRNVQGCGSHAVLPYSQRLARMPAYVQQLEMESLGKSATREGEAVVGHTGAADAAADELVIANCLAQAQAFMAGHESGESQRRHPGNRPLTMIAFPRRSPELPAGSPASAETDTLLHPNCCGAYNARRIF